MSGAPILVGGLVMGLALQELQSNGSTVQNTLFGRHLELVCSPGGCDRWTATWSPRSRGLRSRPTVSTAPSRRLAKGFHIQDLRPVAKKLDVRATFPPTARPAPS
ncbi:MAG: hypothetical protein IPG04_17895 [Polyangiaceae bacterium]|nr:hypothetical protein [Polyangiaceae bacterium]